jgi:protein-L-isoaspartate(D-aspartate) O-methyltransferase
MRRWSEALDSKEARALRASLVQSLVARGDVTSPSVIEALRATPRHLFAPTLTLEEAYENRPFAIGFEQTISQPAIVAQMTEALELSGQERVLEIGTGSGYQAAVLSPLAREVFTIERVEPLALEAARRLEALGYTNVSVRAGDGYAGWPERAPFDRVIVTAAPEALPRALVEQMRDGGILVAPVGPQRTGQSLLRVRKRGDELIVEHLGAVLFVEMLEGVRSA